MIRIVLNIDTSPRVIASQIPSARIPLILLQKKINVVAEQVLQSTECLGRKDRNLAVLIQLTCSCQEEQLAVVESIRHHESDSTSNTFDRHEEFVASGTISWRQGKFSWLDMVFLDCSASNQQTTL